LRIALGRKTYEVPGVRGNATPASDRGPEEIAPHIFIVGKTAAAENYSKASFKFNTTTGGISRDDSGDGTMIISCQGNGAMP
jgi:hypothetical protein